MVVSTLEAIERQDCLSLNISPIRESKSIKKHYGRRQWPIEKNTDRRARYTLKRTLRLMRGLVGLSPCVLHFSVPVAGSFAGGGEKGSCSGEPVTGSALTSAAYLGASALSAVALPRASALAQTTIAPSVINDRLSTRVTIGFIAVSPVCAFASAEPKVGDERRARLLHRSHLPLTNHEMPCAYLSWSFVTGCFDHGDHGHLATRLGV